MKRYSPFSPFLRRRGDGGSAALQHGGEGGGAEGRGLLEGCAHESHERRRRPEFKRHQVGVPQFDFLNRG